MTDEKSQKVIDRLLFTALALAETEREDFIRRLGEHTLNHLRKRGYSDGEILLAKIKWSEMIRERMQELQAVAPDQWGHA
jgi:hypothetical protein